MKRTVMLLYSGMRKVSTPAGLKQKILMVPVRLEDAPFPDNSDLPDSLHEFLKFQSLLIHQRHWKDDVAELIDALAQHPGLERKTRGPAPMPNLSVDWIDTDGVPTRIEHSGESIRLVLLDYYGQARSGQWQGHRHGEWMDARSAVRSSTAPRALQIQYFAALDLNVQSAW